MQQSSLIFNLSNELIVHITLHLNLESYCKFKRTCKRFWGISDDDYYTKKRTKVIATTDFMKASCLFMTWFRVMPLKPADNPPKGTLLYQDIDGMKIYSFRESAMGSLTIPSMTTFMKISTLDNKYHGKVECFMCGYKVAEGEYFRGKRHGSFSFNGSSNTPGAIFNAKALFDNDKLVGCMEHINIDNKYQPVLMAVHTYGSSIMKARFVRTKIYEIDGVDYIVQHAYHSELFEIVHVHTSDDSGIYICSGSGKISQVGSIKHNSLVYDEDMNAKMIEQFENIKFPDKIILDDSMIPIVRCAIDIVNKLSDDFPIGGDDIVDNSMRLSHTSPVIF